jgi:transcriptional regulator with PAS, ATPase and Fis domain
MSSQSYAATCPSQVIKGVSHEIETVRRAVRRIAKSSVPVLLVGETGTGKDVCASAIAAIQGRRPFVPVNCAAFPDTLAESELFGFERGAFTGASRDREGIIAHANNGILFLDELAELSPALQSKLLRTLESGEYRRIGTSRNCTAARGSSTE